MKCRNRDLIRRFYEEIWNPFDKRKIPELLTEDVRFRGSLGQEKFGHSGFTEYMDMIQAAFPDFTNHVEEIISEAIEPLPCLPTAVPTKAKSLACHRRAVAWSTRVLRRFRGEKIAKVWVLGDVHGLLQQLR